MASYLSAALLRVNHSCLGNNMSSFDLRHTVCCISDYQLRCPDYIAAVELSCSRTLPATRRSKFEPETSIAGATVGQSQLLDRQMPIVLLARSEGHINRIAKTGLGPWF